MQELNDKLLDDNKINGKIIVLDGSRFTNDYADKYYAIIGYKQRKNYVKNHISFDVETRVILHFYSSKMSKIRYKICNTCNKIYKEI